MLIVDGNSLDPGGAKFNAKVCMVHIVTAFILLSCSFPSTSGAPALLADAPPVKKGASQIYIMLSSIS